MSNTQTLFPAPCKMTERIVIGIGPGEKGEEAAERTSCHIPPSVSALKSQIDIASTLKVFHSFHGLQGRCQDQNIFSVCCFRGGLVHGGCRWKIYCKSVRQIADAAAGRLPESVTTSWRLLFPRPLLLILADPRKCQVKNFTSLSRSYWRQCPHTNTHTEAEREKERGGFF